jgi:hypothetical protein
MSKDSPPVTSETKPQYPPQAAAIFGAEKDLLQNLLLPAEGRRISSLSALSRGDFGNAGQILSPAFNAARQAQAKLSAGVADLPANIAAPIQEAQAQQMRRLPYQLQAGAPEELSEIVKALIGPQFGSLLAPGSRSTQGGGGMSDFSKAGAGVGVAAALATIGVAI